MRRLTAGAVAFAVLCFGGCNQRDVLSNESASADQGQRLDLNLTSAQIAIQRQVKKMGDDRTALSDGEALARRAMTSVLFDPQSATFLDLRVGRNGAICGKVNAKNRLGAYVGFKDFVVQKDASVDLSNFNDGVETETYTTFASNYVALCASKGEQAAYKTRTTPTSIGDTMETDTAPQFQEPDEVLDAPPPARKPTNTTT